MEPNSMDKLKKKIGNKWIFSIQMKKLMMEISKMKFLMVRSNIHYKMVIFTMVNLQMEKKEIATLLTKNGVKYIDKWKDSKKHGKGQFVNKYEFE